MFGVSAARIKPKVRAAFKKSVAAFELEMLVTPTRFERVAPRLGIWCSILLSYGAVTAVHVIYQKASLLPRD